MRKTILLADDSVTIQKVVELTFMEGDWEVVAVGNGDEALARLGAVAPDLVIADVHMPGASGYDVCRTIKQTRPWVPVLLLVGTFEPFDPLEMESCGADGQLKKPFDSQELQRLVEELAGRASAGAAVGPTSPDEASNRDGTSPGADWGVGAADEAPAYSEPGPADAPAGSPTADWQPLGDLGLTTMRNAEAPAFGVGLSDHEVDRIARRILEIAGDRILREVAWEVVPDLAEVVIKDRLRELEGELEGPAPVHH